jgi:hypothetical protein
MTITRIVSDVKQARSRVSCVFKRAVEDEKEGLFVRG